MDSAVAVGAARVAVVSSRLMAFEGASADVLASMTDRQTDREARLAPGVSEPVRPGARAF